jgi:DNA-binding transcriptional LysR family regulator
MFECLVAVVEHGSVSAAAAALALSRAAVAHQIASIEREVGAPVVERRHRGVRVTAVGRAIATEARLALRAADKVVQVGRRIGRGGDSHLRISCEESMTRWLLVPLLQRWRATRPDIVLELFEFARTDVMMTLINERDTDIAVGPRPPQPCGRIAAFGKEDVVVVATAGHRFSRMKTVSLHDLTDEPFVHYDPANGLAMWVDQLTASHQVLLKAVVRACSPVTAVQLALAGMGVAIVPVSALSSRPAGVVRYFRPMLKRDLITVIVEPSGILAQQFVADIHRCGIPHATDLS